MEPVNNIFDNALSSYKAGESPENLIPVFQEICERSPKNAPAWSCLAWLYLLVDKPNQALKAAQKSVKLDPRQPQARINLALAMLDTGEKGVREHIDLARQMMNFNAEISSDIQENIDDGFSKKPNWSSLERVKNWLLN